MNIRIIDPEAFKKAGREVGAGRYGELSMSAMEIVQEETIPLEGYEEKENFPHCCEYHSSLYKIGQDYYDKFPNCCEEHHRLKTAKWFKKEDYSYLPLKLVRTLSYTWYCIEKSIHNENWYKEIGDYIVYTKESYGQLPNGYGNPIGKELYLENLVKGLESNAVVRGGIPDEKRQVLLEMVKEFANPTPKEEIREMPDLNVLNRTYREWLSVFPFEISFLQYLKPYFENQRPFIESMTEANLYNGMVGAKVISQEGLVNWLLTVTDSIIKEINTLNLHKRGELSDVANVQLELLLAERRQKLDEGYFNASPDAQTRYRRILKAWLKDEKKFIKDLKPLLQDKPLPTSSEKASDTPIFNEQAATTFLEIVKDFFSKKHHTDLQELLNGKKPKEKLLFLSNGNKLADAFKQLFEANFIVGCTKKVLERWILEHFEYKSRINKQCFKPSTLSDIISSDKNKCSNPLLNVTLDKATGKYYISQA